MSEPLVRFRGVNKSFGRADVLRGIDLDLTSGGCMGLAGVNGAGKTTLIKCLLDFCELDSGAIEVQGVEHRRPQARAGLAFLPERFTPPYFLTGRAFVAMMLALYGRRYDEGRVGAMFAALDLDETALEKPVRDYSKGMTQKLGLAACLLSGKELYVLDEPTGGLDPKARALLKNQLKALRGAGHTVFFTSHALADVAEMCDRMAVLHAGRLRFAGTPPELVAQYHASDLEQAFLSCIAS